MYIGIYGSIEKDLLEVNFFRRYKDKVCKMTDSHARDLYNGVIIPYVYFPELMKLRVYQILFAKELRKQEAKVKHLFDTIEDWYTLDFARRKCENKFNMDGREYLKNMLNKKLANC